MMASLESNFPICTYHRIGTPGSIRASKIETHWSVLSFGRNVVSFFAEPSFHTLRLAGVVTLVNQ